MKNITERFLTKGSNKTVEYGSEIDEELNEFLYVYREKEKILRISEKWDSIAVTIGNAIDFAHKYINEEPERYKSIGIFSY